MLENLYWTIFLQSVKYVLLSCNLLSWHLGGDGNLSGKLILCSFPDDDEKLAFFSFVEFCESGAACQLGSKLCQEGLDRIKKGLFARTGKHFLSKMEIFMEVNMT